MNSVLITGGSGFIGGHLAERLSALGIRVKCLVRSSSSRNRLQSCGAEFVRGDVTDTESLRPAVEGVDVVFHLAGLTCALRRADLFRVNGEGPGRLAAACAELANPPVLVQVSSIAAAGPSPAHVIRLESDPPRPISQYGRSKLVGEQSARRFADRVPTTIVRPGVVFGEHDPGMAVMAKSIRQMGIHLNAGFRSPRLSMIYARDLVKILIAAAEKGERLPGIDGGHDSSGLGIYFGVGPDHPTYRELGRIIAPELVKNGSGPWNICVPGSLALLLGATNEAVCWFRGKADIFSRDKVREGLAPSWVCSCEKVRRQLSWQPSATLVDQLRATARWYVQQGWT